MVVLDEPTAGLEEPLCLSIETLLGQAKGTLLVSTSSAKLALRVADRIVLMSQGQILFQGTGSELKDSFGEHRNIPSLKSAYNDQC